jgi:xanthine dehydrogenase molybdenum-binding subunit
MPDEFGPASEFVAIGKRNPEYHGDYIVTGKYDFALDHIQPGTLYARVLGSPHGHAKIKSINTSKAEALAGVKAAVTYKDNPAWSDTLLCVDQPVAAVAAVDEATAERALDLIEVTYEVLPAVFNIDDAMKPGAPLVGTFTDGNTTPTANKIEYGDVAKGFTEADVTIDETVWVSRHSNNVLESNTAVVWWEADDLYMWISGQGVFRQRPVIANTLKMPQNRVHIFCHGTGGGFGGKGDTLHECLCAALSKKTGTPIALNLPRRLYIALRQHQYGGKMRMKMGAKKDGTLTAIEVETWVDGGATGARGGWMDVAQSTWKCPNYKSSDWGVATNKALSGAWRCVQHPGGQFLSDIVLEKMAAKLNINPLEFRRKIFLTEPIFQQTGRPLFSFGTRECLEKVAQAIGYEGKYHAPGTKTLPDGRLHGIGIHARADGHGGMSSNCGSIINMCPDGTVLFNSGSTRVMGGYCDLAEVIAETIGVKYVDVHIGDWGNTDVAAIGTNQGGSVTTITHTSAAMVASQDVRAQIFAVAAGKGTGMLNVTPAELDAKDGKIFLKSDPTKFVTHKAVMQSLSNPIIGRGVHWTPQLRKPVGNFAVGGTGVHRTGCASAAEVAVDPETGEVEILNFANAVDAGRVIDLYSSEGQVAAGLPVQFNQAMLCEEIKDSVTGRDLAASFLDDEMATTMDIPGPDKNQAFLIETIDANGAYGCHGIGEPAVGSYACITNAINNAINKFIFPTPYTPDKILKALGKA